MTWYLDDGVHTCTAVCEEIGMVCSESDLLSLTSQEATEQAMAAAGITCSSWNQWDYGQGLSQCTGTSCCGGSCVGACSRGAPQGCNHTSEWTAGGHHERLCACKGENSDSLFISACLLACQLTFLPACLLPLFRPVSHPDVLTPQLEPRLKPPFLSNPVTHPTIRSGA